MSHQNGIRPGNNAGFTLVELMVTIVIASILLAIAVPSYQSSIRKSRRTDARNAVLDLAGREERYYTTNNLYSQTNTDLGYPAAFPQPTGSGYYTINVTISAAQPTAAPPVPAGYIIKATAIGTQTKDAACQTFSLNQIGLQSSTDSSGATTTGANSACWN
jgi:type IV pilus assembly protein PilE